MLGGIGAVASAVLACVVASGCAASATPVTVAAQRVAHRTAVAPPTSAIAPTPGSTPAPTFNTAAHSIDDPASIWVVVDKRRPLAPKSFVPRLVTVPVPHTWTPRLQPAASQAVVRMFHAARLDGLRLASNSAYRSYSTQIDVYGEDRAANGRRAADALTARPGYSEHQTGLAIDIGAASGHCSLATCFAATPEGRWLLANAWRYGFVLRDPKGLTDVTGFDWEPWHYRYVGVPLSTELHRTGIRTLEQFFGLAKAPSYRG